MPVTWSSSFRSIAHVLAVTVLRQCPNITPSLTLSRLLPALPYAVGSNASDFTAMAFSASPADSTQEVPSAMDSATLPLVRACRCSRVRPPSHPSLCWRSQTVPSRSRGSGDTDARIPPSSRAQAGFLTSLARPAPIFGPQCSPSTSKRTVQRLHRCHRYRPRAHPLALSSSHRHGIAPPRSCDLSRRCSPSCYCHHHRRHRHCDYYHYQDTTQQRT